MLLSHLHSTQERKAFSVCIKPQQSLNGFLVYTHEKLIEHWQIMKWYNSLNYKHLIISEHEHQKEQNSIPSTWFWISRYWKFNVRVTNFRIVYNKGDIIFPGGGQGSKVESFLLDLHRGWLASPGSSTFHLWKHNSPLRPKSLLSSQLKCWKCHRLVVCFSF